MKESEMRMLFLQISNRYSMFAYDDFKVIDWLKLLKDVSAEQAKHNLDRYCLNPDNNFPPHPGILAATTIQQANGPDIPNALQTRMMLEERTQYLMSGEKSPIPESVREVVRRLGTKSSNS